MKIILFLSQLLGILVMCGTVIGFGEGTKLFKNLQLRKARESEFCVEDSNAKRDKNGILEKCVVKSRRGENGLSNKLYKVEANEFYFNDVMIQCREVGNGVCGVKFTAKKSVHIEQSTILLSSIHFEADEASFILGANSALSTSGLSFLGNAGSKYYFGASYAGQGGVGKYDNFEGTYGNFSQEPDDSYSSN